MRITPRTYARFLVSQGLAEPRRIVEIVEAFLELLHRRRARRLLPKIIKLLPEVAGELTGKLSVNLTSAQPLSREFLKDLSRKIEEKLGQPISLTASVDPGLIGGAKLLIGEKVIDATVLGALRQLEERLWHV